MKPEKTNHTADELFAMARQHEPIFTPEQVQQLITENTATATRNGINKRGFIQSHLKLIIMTTIVSIIGISLGLFLSKPENKETAKTNNIQSNIQTQEKIKADLLSTEKEEKKEYVITHTINSFKPDSSVFEEKLKILEPLYTNTWLLPLHGGGLGYTGGGTRQVW